MGSSCNHDCSSCSTGCAEKPKSLIEPCNKYSNVKKLIGVISGKGGVGKSLITSYTTVLMNRMGYKTAILDADITGPSIPKTFGIHEKALGNEQGILPAVTKNGTKLMSVNLLLESEAMPVLWRGPVIVGAVKQFWTDVVWEDVDYMFVDMPPGTGDVPLTVFQSLPLDGIIIVTSPQELVSMIVEKAVNMAKAMNVPIIGLVENYSYLECENCGEKISVFGESHVEEVAAKYGLKVLGKVPINPNIAKAVDNGAIEDLQGDWLDDMASYLKENYVPRESKTKKVDIKKVKIAVPCDEDNNVDQHYNKAKKVCICELEDNKLVARTIIELEDGQDITTELVFNKITTLICGGISQEAMAELFDAGIKVIPGTTGDVDVAISSLAE
ncbi:MAG: dinitrogenase iron-molybdenum cofactor biosynthesis protein [Lachnospiraceae bacterium]|nr:dinitrogenase iron-molybdenum cofactor biosynthesis protein [Lachnospiraceae bacterium]